MLNYFGPGSATFCTIPRRPRNPFYALVPEWALYPMVVLATAAAVVASQALISGAFSLTRQAVQLGYSPQSEHHSHVEHRDRADLRPTGEYCILMVCLLWGWCVTFRSSGRLAATYGVALTR